MVPIAASDDKRATYTATLRLVEWTQREPGVIRDGGWTQGTAFFGPEVGFTSVTLMTAVEEPAANAAAAREFERAAATKQPLRVSGFFAMIN